MADKDVIYHDLENSESSENLSRDEWTFIDKNYSEKDDTDGGDNSADDIEEDPEPSRSMEVISKPGDDAMEDEAGGVNVEKHDDDSDGISVITESEAEQLVGNKESGDVDGCKNRVYGALKMYEKTGEKTAPQVGTILNVVIACSLAAIIGLGAGRILGMDDKCSVSTAMDFSTIKMESDNLINKIKELGEVKDVLDEIKASIPEVKRAQKNSQRGSKSKSKRFERPEESSEISDTYIFDPDTTILEQLQTSLNTLCSVIDGMNPENDFIKSDTSRTQVVVADLIKFQKIIYNVVKELGDTGRPKEIEFLRHAEKKIRDVCESLLSDLSYTVHGLTMKIHHKLNKVRHKLNKRLCLLKDSESMDKRVFRSLEENNSFLESCDKILNVTLKPSTQSIKTDENKQSNKKIYLKMKSNSKKRSPKKSVFESEDDSYPRDSSSDTSMPDLSYDPKDDDFWKKKTTLRKGGKEAEGNSGKFVLENDIECGKIRSSKSTKSSRGQRSKSLRKLMMEVLVPADSCPLTHEQWMESESVYPESQRLEVPSLNSKPLYSTVLKSVIDVSSSVKNDLDNEKLPRKQIPENTKAGVDGEEIEQNKKQEVRVEVPKTKEDLKEIKHNVTPAESGINVQTIKSMKEQWNTNIRQPVGKDNGAPQEAKTLEIEEILAEKNGEPEQLENIAQVPLAQGNLRHCRKGKKCLPNYSTGSNKIPATTTGHADTNKHKKSSNEKTENNRSGKIRNNDGKKPKNVKQDRKFSKLERDFKKRDNQKINDQLAGDWQLQRSRAREMHRNRDHRSEWFFDRADSRQDARKDMNKVRGSKSRAGRFSCYQPCKYYGKDKCEMIFDEWIPDGAFSDLWHEAKDMNDQKHSTSRAGFMAKRMSKMPHRKNIMQSIRH